MEDRGGQKRLVGIGGRVKPYYEGSGIVIYHGDCADVLPGLGRRFDLMLTDPPYGLGARLAGGTWGAKYAGGLEWDQRPADLSNLLPFADAAVVWGGNYFALPPRRCWLVWRKPDAVRTMADCDLAWTTLDAPSRCLSYSIAATNAERVAHPTQKPLAVISWCLSHFPGAQTVVDPFMGSGTTLVAAKEHNRTAIGVEIDERYCEIAARRLSQEVLDLGAA
jgi:site-specific DNA-methyltransferase (adenine-specific)